MSSLIQTLLKRGDQIAVQKGQLLIMPRSGAPVPKSWLNKNTNKIMSELAQSLNQSIYTYSFYKTGTFNNGRSPGVIVRFLDLLNGEDVFAIFNADLKRKRTTRGGNAGESLPIGQFHIGERSALYKLWLKTDIELPRRRSELYKSMNRLKLIYFIANRSSGTKLANNSIQPLSCPSDSIIENFSGYLEAPFGQAGGSLGATFGGKTLGQCLVTSNGDKKLSVEHASIGLDSNSNCVSKQARVPESAEYTNAYNSNRVSSNQVMASQVVPLTPIKKPPEEQSTDEWLDDYNSASSLK